MSLLTVEGIYKEGKVELIECPEHVEESARVLVTFLPPGAAESIGDKHQDRETLRQRAFAHEAGSAPGRVAISEAGGTP